MSVIENAGRRRLLRMTLAAGGMAATGALLSVRAFAGDKATVNMQLGWMPGGNQIGEVVGEAARLLRAGRHRFPHPARRPEHRRRGDRRLGPLRGRPGFVEPVDHAGGLAGPADQVLRGRRCSSIRTRFFSLKKNPVRTPQDMVGKKVGIQSTGMMLLARAAGEEQDRREGRSRSSPIGADMTPLLTGQVDVVTGWLTNTTALKVLGADRVDLRLWDTGVRLYALPYYATTKTLQTSPTRCCRASCARPRAAGIYANANRDAAVDLLVKEYPNLNRADERVAHRR